VDVVTAAIKASFAGLSFSEPEKGRPNAPTSAPAGSVSTLRVAAALLLVVLVELLACGCAPVPSPMTAPSRGSTDAGAVDCGLPSAGERVVILVAGTMHDPRPALTSRAVDLLRAAARSTAARNGRGAAGSVAIVTSFDEAVRQVLPLTPRRSNCEVEHGLQREPLIEANVDRVMVTVSLMTASQPGLDLLSGLDNAVRGLPPGQLIVVSNGLSTSGGFDLRQARWLLTPQDLVAQLNARGLLADLLTGWQVLFVGLGETMGDQPPLTKPTRDTLFRYMCAIAAAGGAARCDIDRSPLDPVPPTATVADPVVVVPGLTSVVGPDGHTTTTLSDSALEFTPDSATLTPDALDLLRGIAAHITARLTVEPDAVVTIRGYVADPPSSTAASRQELSARRAAAVADALTAQFAAHGLAPRIDAAGAGTPPGVTALVNGSFDEAVAQTMRKVTVTY
jgi:outer membrane protein OmpA-like peptidoglycan-associated protein